MKTKLTKFCQGTGTLMFLLTAALGETESIAALMVWIAVSIMLLYAGKSFSFQQENK